MRIETLLAPNPGPYTLDGTRSYIIDRRVVVDPGPDIASHIQSLRERLDDAPLVLLTHRHPDHVPAAIPLRDQTGARIIGPEGVGVRLDHVVSDGDTLELPGCSLRVIATPGHTAEHVCYLGDGGELFSGDTVLGTGTTVILPPDGSMRDYLASLRKLSEAKPRIVYPGHGPIRTDGGELIESYIAHRLEREAQILRLVEMGVVVPAAMRESIYPELDSRLHAAAESQILAHLAHMEEREVVVRGGDGAYAPARGS